MTTVAASSHMDSLEYRVSLDRLAELNRSPVPLILARTTSSCPSYGSSPGESDDPAALIREIRANCGNDPDYIRQSMPLQEIVFRMLLLAEDQTMTLGDLHRELTERWSSAIRPITVTVSGLARILDSDVFYGFDAVPLPEPEVVESDLPMLNAGDEVEDNLLREILSSLDEDSDEEEDLFDDDDDDPYEEDEEDNED